MAALTKKEMSNRIKKEITLADNTTIEIVHSLLEKQRKIGVVSDEEIQRRFEEMERGENCIRLTIEEFEERAKARFAQRNAHKSTL